MTIEQIIGKYDEAIMEAHADLMRDELNTTQIKALRESLELFTAGRDAIREKQERENPQALTVEELREMDGEPVWVESQSCKWWEIVYSEGDILTTDTDHYLYLDSYGTDWIAYRYPPKEER